MTPRDNRTGAAPEAEMVRLDSDVNHLREQADIDRRTEAAFRVETRQKLDVIELAISTQGATSARIEDKVIRMEQDGAEQTKALARLADIVIEQRGALRFLKFAVPLALAAVELIARMVHP